MQNNKYNTKIVYLDQFTALNQVVFKRPPACYTLYGDLTNGKKLALIFHGFSSSSEPHAWWNKFPLDNLLNDYNILCINSLGSSHGSLGPDSMDPNSGRPYLEKFPLIEIQDTVNFTIEVLKKLQIDSLDLILGCSIGGMQALDMFLRFPEYGRKYISVCGAPLPLSTKLMNIAQLNMLEHGIKNKISENELRVRMGFARLFFRLSCTTERALSILIEKKTSKSNKLDYSILEDYFILDGHNYKDIFSPYSYYIYMKMLVSFNVTLPLPDDGNKASIVLVDITGDQFTPPDSIMHIYNSLKNNSFSVIQKTFETPFGHEAWILDGGNFYEFIKDEFIY